ncbi:formylglycine-generating enzyme required for sulfatase activity [Methylobacterium sp. OAE515]|uniref:bifunctional serine/threonine-protein kinase/formylglycine-generating enzyme family protein n=1 Tax=Methylobacterium sp. OAE515 TaxID=2817895 RepID=UPI0017894107
MLFEYRIDAVLGFGGFGITYLAHDTLLDEVVAIKEFFPSFTAVRTADQSARARSTREAAAFKQGVDSFLNEARIIARFRHPNIMQVRRFFEAHGTGYMVLEFVHGRSLEAALVNAPLPEPEVRQILEGIVDGLSVLHDQAILHRDLKPRNVILRPDGNPVLIDFGAARDFGFRHSATVTQIVSPNYSSPEQYGVGSQQGPWSDFYALGAVLYRAVTGSIPVDALRRLRSDPLEAASHASAGRYDPVLLKLIDTLMAIDPEGRPGSVDAIREVLGSSFDPADRIAPTERPGRHVRIASSGTSASSSTMPVRSRRVWAIAFGVSVLAVAGGAGLWLVPRGSGPEKTVEAPDALPPTEHRQTAAPTAAPAEEPRDRLASAQPSRPADPRPGTTFKDCPTCPPVVVIPAGSFRMGSVDGRPDERPVHDVTFAAPFAIGQREVTEAEWAVCVSAGFCNPRKARATRGEDPATNLSWLDVQTYLTWLSGATGRRYRLPSEAEWEYAARGGTSAAYWWGGAGGSDHANCADCSNKPNDAVTRAGSYPSNPFGLYDTAGNAAEWVQDCWTPDYGSAPSDGSAKEIFGCSQRVLRGGSFVNDARYLRSASRYHYEAATPYYAHGFRVATDVRPR